MDINELKELAGINEKNQRDMEHDFVKQHLNLTQSIEQPKSPIEQLLTKLNNTQNTPPINTIINKLNNEFNLEASIIINTK